MWFYWEVHERHPDGSLSGTPKIKKNYRGGLNFSSIAEAEEFGKKLTQLVKEELSKG